MTELLIIGSHIIGSYIGEPHIGEPHITELMTMLTDYLLAIESVSIAVLLHREGGKHGNLRWWVTAFWVTALAVLAGGTAHGFALYLDPWLATVWTFTVLSIAACAALLMYTRARQTCPL